MHDLIVYYFWKALYEIVNFITELVLDAGELVDKY